MEEQLILYVRYTAKPGCRESFVRDIVEAGILTQIRQEDGCLAYDYYFSAQDENEVLLIERWESAAHQRVHMESPIWPACGSQGQVHCRHQAGPRSPGGLTHAVRYPRPLRR